MRCGVVIFVLGLTACGSAPKQEPARATQHPVRIADDVSYPHMGAYGTPWVKTPGFDRVAREGCCCGAYTPNAKCAPSRAIILTGRNSWQLEAAGNHWPYFPARSSRRTPRACPERLLRREDRQGLDARGGGRREGEPRELAGTPSTGARPSRRARSRTTTTPPTSRTSSTKPQGQPSASGTARTSRTGATSTGLASPRAARTRDIDKVPPYWPDTETVRTDMLDYAFEIEHFDQHLERMLALLESGELAETLVVVTADNGMPFPGEGTGVRVSNHMPLAVMWPRGIRNPGRAVEDYVRSIVWMKWVFADILHCHLFQRMS